MTRKIFIIALFMAGVMLVAWPRVESYIGDKETQELLEAWNSLKLEQFAYDEDQAVQNEIDESDPSSVQVVQIDTASEEEAAETSEGPAADDSTASSSDGVGVPAVQPPASPPAPVKIEQKNIVGALEIAKINLNLPILEGSTPENMRNALTTIKKNQTPGEGNYAIAGHRNAAYGKNFNRLMEVEVDDELKLDDGQQQYIYRVSEVFLVDPSDVDVIRNRSNMKEITLVTCHPVKNPTHRLIVRGVLEDIASSEG